MSTSSKAQLAEDLPLDTLAEIAPSADDNRAKVRRYIIDSILLGTFEDFDDSASLLDAGILDSTGTMELVAYLEHEFGLAILDEDITADNLDSVERICRFIERARVAGQQA